MHLICFHFPLKKVFTGKATWLSFLIVTMTNEDGFFKDGYTPRLLYELRPGQLKIRRKEFVCDVEAIFDKSLNKKTASDGTTSCPSWCWFPPSSRTQHTQSARVTENDFASALSGLPLIERILSKPYGNLLDPKSLRTSGEMSSLRRIAHTESTYMSTGEMGMMLSILMADGRYDDEVSIVPFGFCEAIQIAAKAYIDLGKADLHKKQLLEKREQEKRKDMTEEYELNEAFWNVIYPNPNHPGWKAYGKSMSDEFKEFDDETNALLENEQYATIALDDGTEQSVRDIEEAYVKAQWTVVEQIVEPNPSILRKRLLIVPKCDNNHWTCIFVFNPSDIKLAATHKHNESSHALQPCFFRYCPMDPTGMRDDKIDMDLIWFLNLCYSFDEMSKQTDLSTNGMMWLEPFGCSRNPQLRGSSNFPSMRLVQGDELPHQHDVYNCGFGVIATIGIILRDVVGIENSETRELYRVHFYASVMVSYECESLHESFIYLPERLLKPLPKANEEMIPQNYLASFREEWFICFDRLAELYHFTIKQRINPSRPLNNVDYIGIKQDLKWRPRLKDFKAGAAQSLLDMKATAVVTQSQTETNDGPAKATSYPVNEEKGDDEASDPASDVKGETKEDDPTSKDKKGDEMAEDDDGDVEVK